MEILTNTPLYVWPLLVGLGWVSILSMKDRRTPLVVLYALPLLGLLSLKTVAGLPAPAGIWGIFALAYGVGAVIGWRRQSVRTVEKTGRDIRQKGEGGTAVAVATLFVVNFVVGAIGGMAPELLATWPIPALATTLLGLASGTFGGRALCVLFMSRDMVAA